MHGRGSNQRGEGTPPPRLHRLAGCPERLRPELLATIRKTRDRSDGTVQKWTNGVEAATATAVRESRSTTCPFCCGSLGHQQCVGAIAIAYRWKRTMRRAGGNAA